MFRRKTRIETPIHLVVPALALALAGAGCGGLDFADESGALESSTAEIRQGACKDQPVYFSRTQIGPNRYLFLLKIPAGPPPSRVWREVRDFEQLVPIALPGIATDFQWVDGGGPKTIPSSFQFVAFGTTIHEQIYARDDHRHSLRYRVLVPALGIAAYDSEIKLLPKERGKTEISITRDITFEAGADPQPLTDLTEQEGNTLRDYFCS